MMYDYEVEAAVKNLPVEIEDGVVKFILPKARLTVPRYLTRQLKLTEHGWKDDKIRDLAEKIELRYFTPEIVYCEKPEDYIRMYECGNGSCMRTGMYTYVKGIGQEFWEKQKLWPTTWCAYHPGLKGVYTVAKGKVTARAFIVDGKKFDSYYADIGAHRDFLTAELIKLNLQHQNAVRAQWKEEFKVPSVFYKDTYWCPLPNCDNVYKPFYIRYDADTHEFIFSGKKGFKIESTYNYPGWISHTQVK